MGNSQAKGQVKIRSNKKQVHWKAADRPSPPGKPELVSGGEITPDVVTIRWDRPKSDGGTTITGYLVEHRRTGSPHWVRATPLLVPVPELTLSGLEPGWRYQFRITAQNVVGMSDPGEVSEPLTVTLQRSVITAPKFTEELKDTTALENDMAEFTVHVIGQPPPKICWFKDGFEIFSSRRTRIITENDKSVLTIHQVALTDEGEIKCTATNKAGHVSTKAILKIEAPPVIRLPRQYEDGLLFELDEVMRLKVSIAGRPQPLVFWSHNGESIPNHDRYEITDADKSSVLKISEAKRSDRGEYQIKAVNKLGEDSTSFLVTVTDKPRPPTNLRVIMSLGKTVTLSWELPEDDGGCKIGNYIVEYYRLGWNVWLKASTCRQLSTTLSDLIEGSEYKFRVKAESPYGLSDPSEETDVIFIPDPKRGLLTAPPRSRSQPKEIERATSPVPPKRRSTSSSRQKEQQNLLIPAGLVPTPPKRGKIKSPQRTPESSPLARRKYMFDRSSLARDLSYGSPPDTKYKKPEVKTYLEPKPQEPEARYKKPEPKLLEPVKTTTLKDQKSNLVNQLLPNKDPKPEKRSPSPNKNETIKDKSSLPANGPNTPRDRSPSIINTLIANILPSKKTPSPSPSPPQENASPVVEHKEPSIITSLKGDQLDRLSPIPTNRRLSSPSIDQKEKSPSPRNLSASFTENSRLNAEQKNNSSPNQRRSPSPSKYALVDDGLRRGSLQGYQNNNNDMMHGSSEFMLVLVEDQDGANEDYYMFEDSLIPPPLSLSAPELGAELDIFMPLKTSVSSTELLHERAFARFAKEAEESSRNGVERRSSIEKNEKLKVIEMDERRSSIPKIQINSKDNEDIVGLERKSSLKRRLSAGVSNISQSYSWAKRRHSLRNSADNPNFYDMKSEVSGKMKNSTPERSISESTKIRDDFTANNRQDSPKRLEDNRQESLEESVYSEEESEESEDERFKADLSPPHVEIQEEDTYHPRMMIPTERKKFEEPFEILSKPLPIPDPNVVPSKSILKRNEELKKLTPDKPARKFLPNQFDERPISPLPTVVRSRTPSPSPTRVIPPRELSPAPVQMRNIQEKQMMAAGEAAKEKRMRRQSSEEEYKVVADHYMDLVREYGLNKKPYVHNTYLTRDDLKSAAEEQEEEKVEEEPKKEPSPVRTSSRLARHEARSASRRNASPCPPRTPLPNEKTEELKVPETKAKSLRDRSSSRTRPRDNSGTRKRNTSETRNKREPSVTRTTKREVSATRTNKDSNASRAASKDNNKTKTREVSATRTSNRDSNTTRKPTKRETSSSRNNKREAISAQEKAIISRSPSPRPLTPEQEAMQAEAEIIVRSTMEYLTDVAMFVVACWLYLFKDARLAIPLLIIMVYRQLKNEVKNMIPAWMMRKKK